MILIDFCGYGSSIIVGLLLEHMHTYGGCPPISPAVTEPRLRKLKLCIQEVLLIVEKSYSILNLNGHFAVTVREGIMKFLTMIQFHNGGTVWQDPSVK